MKRRPVILAAVVGLVLTAPLAALMYLGGQLAGLPIAYGALFAFLRDHLPGGVLTFGIESMNNVFTGLGMRVDTAAKATEILMAVTLYLLLGAIAGAIFGWSKRTKLMDGLLVGLFAWIVTLAAQVATKPGSADFETLAAPVIWWGILYAFWGVALAWLFNNLMTPVPVEGQTAIANTSRRRFLLQLGGTIAALTAGAWGLGLIIGQGKEQNAPGAIASLPTVEPTATGGATAASDTTQIAPSAFIPAPGTRPEVTPNDRFYRVDVDIADIPDVDQNTWSLSIGGLVDKPYSLSYADLLKMPPIEQDATQECISNEVGGGLISSTRWRGVKLIDLLNVAGLKSSAVEIKFTCDDGYTESLPIDAVKDERTLVVYAMNGEPLLREHGFPIRIYVPNRYGMKNPKWVSQIEAIDQPYDGYWEVRGWNKEAIVKTTSVIDSDTINSAQDSLVPVGGIAFAGDRGISKVEVSIDGGAWQAADLKDPISPLTWRLWRFDSKAASGSHTVVVRATDGQGALQTDFVAPTHPDGASGFDGKTINVT